MRNCPLLQTILTEINLSIEEFTELMNRINLPWKKQEVIDLLKEIKPTLQKNYGIDTIALFGSYSRGEQTAESDIDILVEHSMPLGFKFLDMIYELDNLFKKEVQVVSKSGIKAKYLDAIKPDLIYV